MAIVSCERGGKNLREKGGAGAAVWRDSFRGTNFMWRQVSNLPVGIGKLETCRHIKLQALTFSFAATPPWAATGVPRGAPGGPWPPPCAPRAGYYSVSLRDTGFRLRILSA